MNTNKIKTGVASFGMSGQVFHAPFVELHEGFELTAIVERTKELSKAQYPNVRIVRSFDELIAIPELELVVVNTPDMTHYEYCKKALNAGKNVIVEKPFVFDIAQGEELKKLAEEKGLLLTVYQNRRWDSDYLTVKKVMESGMLGRPMEFISTYERYRDAVPGTTWKETADNRVGTTYNLGTHTIDQIVQLFGMPDSLWATIDVLRDNGQIDDYFQIQMLYPKLKVTARGGFMIRDAGPRFAIHGMKGSFLKFGLDVQEDALKRGEKPGIPGWGMEPESIWGTVKQVTDNGLTVKGKIESVPGNYFSYYDNIYAVLREGAEPAVKLNDVLNVLRVIDAAFESNRTGVRVNLK